MNIKNNNLDFKYGIALWIVLLCVAVLYFQGISSEFILDDEINLEEIKNIQEINYWQDSFRFIASGQAGPLGRPISLFSFTLQSYAWPDAAYFKYINICLHLLIGSLIFWFLLILGRLLNIKNSFLLPLSLMSTTIWLFSPLQTSTVLYVIQRMVQIATLFSMLSFIAYLHGRQHLLRQQIKRGLAWMSLGVGGFGLLAIFSKENAALIPLFILVIEFTLLQHLAKTRIWHIWASIFLYIPVSIIFIYLIFLIDPINDYIHRPFTLSERLLTEPRVLLDYLYKLFLPLPHKFSLFQDDYVISTGLWQPISTLFSIVTLISSLIFAFFIRHRYPIIAFSILWFYAGHLLEATTIPIFIYFEHRNYLPILGPIFGSVYLLMRLYQSHHLSKMMRQFVFMFSTIWCVYIGVVSWSSINTWRNPLFQAIYWAEQKPQSRYAQTHAAQIIWRKGYFEKALPYYQHMTKAFPEDISPHLLWLGTHCIEPSLPAPNQQQLLHQLRYGQFDYGLISVLQALQEQVEKTQCEILNHDNMKKIFTLLLENPNLETKKALIHFIYSFVLLEKNFTVSALNQIEKSLSTKGLVFPEKAKLIRLALLIRLQQYTVARDYLSELNNSFTLFQKSLYKAELDFVTQQLPKAP
jgi:hypothetical protein